MASTPARDPSPPLEIRRSMHELDPILGENAEVVDVVRYPCEQLVHGARP
jgi:hypothetical protein